jgi:hypothetical protein
LPLAVVVVSLVREALEVAAEEGEDRKELRSAWVVLARDWGRDEDP